LDGGNNSFNACTIKKLWCDEITKNGEYFAQLQFKSNINGKYFITQSIAGSAKSTLQNHLDQQTRESKKYKIIMFVGYNHYRWTPLTISALFL